MSKATVTIGFGKANMSNTLATYGAMKVSAPFARISAVTSGASRGAQSRMQVGQFEHTGVLITAPVEHPLGTVILLQASWKRNGAPLREGALFLRLRVGAPLYNIMAFIPTGWENMCGDRFMMFSGYADILNAEELEQQMIEINNSYIRRFMEEEEIGECFEILESQPESIPRPSLKAISTPTGIQMREIADTPTRRIILKRRT